MGVEDFSREQSLVRFPPKCSTLGVKPSARRRGCSLTADW